MKIAIQGGPACFHEAAAHTYFKRATLKMVYCQTFREVCEALEQGRASFALMAIENTLAGSILPNYSLLQQFNFSIIAEVWLPIEQHLMALPGQTLQGISQVRSHPVALLQCGDFLKQNPHMDAQASLDTADSARAIKEKELRGVAAIAGRQAAVRYGLEILSENIADSRQNFTRFLVLAPGPYAGTAPADKASLLMGIPHCAGASFVAVLAHLHKQSGLSVLLRYIPATAAHTHLLAADLQGHNKEELQQAIALLRPLVPHLRILGFYQKAHRPLTLNQESILKR